MIKFFRKIRQRLISENRFSKYLMYAVGEIFLVVIGILLALQVNNWSQKRFELGLETEYMERLKKDLKEDILRFRNYQNSSLSIKRDVLELLSSATDVEDIISNPLINGENLSISAYSGLPETQSTTYEELKNSGGIRLIRNQDIRLILDDYYDSHEIMSGILQKSPGLYKEILYGSLPGKSTYNSRVNKQDYTALEKKIGFNLFLNHTGKQEAINLEFYYTATTYYWLNQFITDAENSLDALELEYPSD